VQASPTGTGAQSCAVPEREVVGVWRNRQRTCFGSRQPRNAAGWGLPRTAASHERWPIILRFSSVAQVTALYAEGSAAGRRRLNGEAAEALGRTPAHVRMACASGVRLPPGLTPTRTVGQQALPAGGIDVVPLDRVPMWLGSSVSRLTRPASSDACVHDLRHSAATFLLAQLHSRGRQEPPRALDHRADLEHVRARAGAATATGGGGMDAVLGG
jgi:hypothetical protein